jgi:hypothetical protein
MAVNTFDARVLIYVKWRRQRRKFVASVRGIRPICDTGAAEPVADQKFGRFAF